MKGLGFEPDEFTFVSIFGACACLENIDLVKQLHSSAIKSNLEVCLFFLWSIYSDGQLLILDVLGMVTV